MIFPWEYRHLRGWARVRIAFGLAATALGGLTLSLGGDDWKTYGWTTAFLIIAVGNWAFACWELAIARSQD